MITLDELNAAITTIRIFCTEKETCDECPLGLSKGDCSLLEDRPFTWPNTLDIDWEDV